MRNAAGDVVNVPDGRAVVTRMIRVPWHLIASGLLGALVLAACAPPPGVPEPRLAFPIKVEQKPISLAVRLTAVGDERRIADPAALAAFVRDYDRRGQSPLVITTAPGLDAAAGEALTENVRAGLVSAGVRPGDILVRPGIARGVDANTIVVGFRGNVAVVPDCGDWSGEAGFNPTNLAHRNYGCAYQRNLGLMLADPGELEKARAPGAIDAQRMDQVIKHYRAGEATGAATPAQETSGVSDVTGGTGGAQ